ncbi:MAG: hypothetical protein VX252_14315 [Myxococcota bacterium]|nr:hypothetical protein [Myxococcota bacterium]
MTSFWKFAVRDLALISSTALAWWAFAGATAGSGLLSDLLGLILGLAFGVSVFLLHEWGHWLGAVWGKSEIHAPRRLSSFYLFSYDSKANSRRQFLAMSLSGFVVTGLAIAVAYGPLAEPLQSARVARGAIAFLASLTVFIEIPILVFSLFSSKLPPVETFSVATAAEPEAP